VFLLLKTSYKKIMKNMNCDTGGDTFHSYATIRTLERGGTIYLVEYSTSDNAKETAHQKIKRPLLNDHEAVNAQTVS